MLSNSRQKSMILKFSGFVRLNKNYIIFPKKCFFAAAV